MRALACLLMASLTACASMPEAGSDPSTLVIDETLGTAAPDGGPPASPPRPELTTTLVHANTGSEGETTVTVPIVDQRAFMVVATTRETAARLSVLDITGPDGQTLTRWEDWYEGSRNLTGAFYADGTTTTINWPIRAEDPPLVPGDYVVRLGSYRRDGTTSRRDVPIEITVLTAPARDPTRGRLRVLIIWAAGLADDAALGRATESAVAHWRDMWAPMGLAIDVRYAASDVRPRLPYPSPATDRLLRRASSLAELGEIPVLLGRTVDRSTSQYGAAGAMPGPVIGSSVSAVLIGWLASAGTDGRFDAGEIDLYGEVLAHEVGHYMGLFHPYEDGYESWDALADTPDCADAEACEAAFSSNLMVPYSSCDGESCQRTRELTADQRGVLLRYAGVL